MIKTLKDNNGKELSKKVQDRANSFVNNLKNIPWFNPKEDLRKKDIDKQINFTLKCFGIEAGIEYRKLETKEAWDSAIDSAWDSAWDSAMASAGASVGASVWDSAWASVGYSAWDSAWDSAGASAMDSAIDSAGDSAWASARDSARASAWASVEILLEDNESFNKKYPNGAFKQLFKLWEMGLYPVGVLKENGKFVVYSNPKARDLFKQEELPKELRINGSIYILKNNQGE